MRRHVVSWTSASLVLTLLTSLAAGDEVMIKAPFAFVRVAGKDQPAPGIFVEAPFVRLAFPRRPAVRPGQPPVAAPGGQPVEVLPPPKPISDGEVIVEPPASPPIVQNPIPQRPPTHAEFARVFKPMPGAYEVVLLHPRTHAPVKACFHLPSGYPKKIRVERDELEFDYGKYEVEIRFKRDGRVSVEYND